MNPFKTVKDYASMLNRIMWFTFLTALLMTYILKSNLPELASLLAKLDIPIKTDVITVRLGMILPALAVMVFSRIFALHNILSTLFGIRKRFDIENILLPMALLANVKPRNQLLQIIAKNRKVLMDNVFYRYASSGENMVVIDKHLIQNALDKWSWYWVVLESTAVVFISAIIFAICGFAGWAFFLMLVFCLCLLALKFLRIPCVHYAEREINAILSETTRNVAIKDYFDALPS